MARALVTGGFGQIGSDLVPALVERYRDHADSCVVVLGHSRLPVTREQAAERGFILETGDVRDGARMRELIQQHRITVVYHLASLLSAVGERDPALTFDVNVNGLRVLLDVAVELGGQLRVFWASSIAVFGASTPRDNTPQDTVTAPSTMYGITKVTGELLCAYYHRRYGVDVRSLRYPGLISWKEVPPTTTTSSNEIAGGSISIRYCTCRSSVLTSHVCRAGARRWHYRLCGCHLHRCTQVELVSLLRPQ